MTETYIKHKKYSDRPIFGKNNIVYEIYTIIEEFV